jgi:RND family efflux transporter MFP subunit
MATVSSQVKGTLFRLHVDREQEVAAGQIVAEVAGMEAVDPQLDLLQTEREVAWLEATLQRLQAGGQTQVVAAKLLWEWESRLNAARNKRAAAERLLLTLGMSREELAEVLQRGEPRDSIPIRSPIAGRVVRVNKTLGEGVGADESLLEVCDYRRVWAQGFLLEQEAGRIGTGLPARVKLVSRPDFLGLGQIVRSAQQIGEQDRTLSVWVEFGQPEGFVLQRNLLAELTATLSSSQSALAVPRSALARDGIRNYVFVQKPDGLLERRMVVVGRADDRWVEVRGGLQAGEIVAVQGVSELATTYAGVR